MTIRRSVFRRLAPNLLYKLAGENMKVAVTEYQGRVAPVFDTSTKLLVFTLGETGDREIGGEDWSALSRHSRVMRLQELGVDALICGGISCLVEEQIIRRGIQLMSWRSGEISEVLLALREGKLTDPCYAMPGRLGRCHRLGQAGSQGQGRGCGAGRRKRKE
jgi:predicted Fe-Mo cluster-binding NifX family protein